MCSHSHRIASTDHIRERSAVIVLDENLIGMWFIPISDRMDWLCGLTRLDAPGFYRVQYRFRQYSPVGDGDPWNGEDVSRWWEVDFEGEEKEVLGHAQDAAR